MIDGIIITALFILVVSGLIFILSKLRPLTLSRVFTRALVIGVGISLMNLGLYATGHLPNPAGAAYGVIGWTLFSLFWGLFALKRQS